MYPVSEHEAAIRLGRAGALRTWLFPGRWMPDCDLAGLRQTVCQIARSRLEDLPDYGVFRSGRDPWRNRVITVAYERGSWRPVGFSAMVYCPVDTGKRVLPVMHLGLVVLDRRPRIRNLLLAIYYFPLACILVLRELAPYWITSVSMEPTIIGAVSDCFDGTYPHYRGCTRPDPIRLAIARNMVARYGPEFGAGPDARLREDSFVIEGSCRGPSEQLRRDFREAARYPLARCNSFCRAALDFDRGDELLQVAGVSLRTAANAVLTPWRVRRLLRSDR
jgi:hypothetical protein